MGSRMIADPITLLQMCPNADGAAAVVVTGDPSANADARSVQILSSVVVSGRFFQGSRDMAWPDITLRAADKALLGQTAATLRGLRKPDPYKGKGIKYADEVIRRKVGKKAGAK